MHQAEANEKKVKGLEYRYHLTHIFLNLTYNLFRYEQLVRLQKVNMM